MSAERHARIGAIFSEARRRPDGERTAYVSLARAGDAGLRDEVEALLAEHRDSSGFLDTRELRGRLGAIAAESVAAETPMPGRIGAFRIVRGIGEGGMGTVYEAEQDEPSRRVALKVIRGGPITHRVLQRFREEAHVLGQLRHPGIAQIYQAGTDDSGGGPRPYFAMELVSGPPLLEYARTRALGMRERLELLARICDALHHAHQKGIVHRDLKPANVLVEQGIGQPKILDFGVARVTNSDIAAVTVQTDAGQLIGTVPYMSPEQAGGDVADLDIRSDVYSLGVLAYELLSGRLPYTLDGKLIHEAVRVIRESEPTRLGSIDRALRGDVETIVATALAKEKERRYQSAAELAADIRRFLADEPIAARPTSAIEQVRKFTRRNRALVVSMTAGLAFAFVALLGATLFSLRQARIATSAHGAAARQAYRATITASAAALEAGDAQSARRQLDEVAEAQRGWEWRYLDANFDEALALIRPGEPVMVASFAAGAAEVLGVTASGALRRWDAATGDELGAMSMGIEGPVSLAACARDGATVALVHGPASRSLSAWSLSGTELRLLGTVELPAAPRSIACTADGRRVAASLEQQALVWETASLAAAPLEVRAGYAGHRMSFSDDGSLIAIAGLRPGTNVLRVFGVETGAVALSVAHPRDFVAAVIAPDGRVVASGGLDKQVRLRAIGGGGVLHDLPGHGDLPGALAFSPDGRTLASGGADLTLRLWDAEAGRSIDLRSGHDAPIQRIGFSGDGSRIVTLAADGLRVWSAPAEFEPQILGRHASYVYCVAYSPDGERLYTGGWDNLVIARDAFSGDVITAFPARDRVTSLAISPDGGTLAVGTANGWLELTSSDRPSVPRTLAGHGGDVAAVAFSPDGSRLLSCSSAAQAFLWDLASGRRLLAVEGTDARELGAAFSPDGDRFAVAHAGGAAIHETESGALLAKLAVPSAVHGLAWSPDGAWIAAAAADHLVHLFDAASGAPRAVLEGHASNVYAVAFSPDGSRLASGSDDTTVRIWDLQTGAAVARLRGHHDYVFDLAFSPDGRTLASASGDFTVRAWDTFPRRVRLGEMHRRDLLRAELRPMVIERLAALEDPGALSAALRNDASLDPLRRELSLQVAAASSLAGGRPVADPFDGSALEFHGGMDHVLIGTSEDFRFLETFTFEAWVYPADDANPALRYIVNREGEYQLARAADGTLQFTVASGPGWHAWRRLRCHIPAGYWSHVALVHSPDGVGVFVNGVPVATQGPPGPIGDVHSDENQLRIGNRQRGGASLRGLIDEVRIWSVARSAQELRDAMQSTLSGDEPGLVASWSFDEGAGSIARDRRGRHDGRLEGVTWRQTSR